MPESQLNVGALALSYRRLVLWFGVQLLVALGGEAASAAVGEQALGIAVAVVQFVGILITIVALALYAYRTAAALGSRVGVVWAVAMLIPCINAITLLVLSSRATSACRAAGIPVGLLGPRLPSPEVPTVRDEDAG